MLIPRKVKQDAINKCSSLSLYFSFSQLKIFVEDIQVEHKLCKITASQFYAFRVFSKSFFNFISHLKGLDVFVSIVVFRRPLLF